jgi:hypothetical protein
MPQPIYTSERPGAHCTEVCVGPSDGPDGCGKTRPQGIQPPDLPARSDSL